jgi:chloramphenicol-sensitive protein RarD
MGAAEHRDTPAGLAYALVAYIWWGAMPLYIWHLTQAYNVPAAEVLGQRIFTGLFFLILVVLVMRRLPDFKAAIVQPRLRAALLASTLLVGINWYVYTWAVVQHRATEASLGYFIQPLLNAALGVILFRERFRPGQILSLGIAVIGVGVLISLAGEWPWIALTLAFSFGMYSTIRKLTPVDGLVGLTIETLFLFPAATGYLLWLWQREALVFGSISRTADAWILVSGIITSIPMIFFGQAARRLRLSTLGFIQFLSPSMQFILAVTVMGESFTPRRLIGFAIIWAAVVIFIIDSLWAVRRGHAAVDVEAPTE